jgi:hypothetical protein
MITKRERIEKALKHVRNTVMRQRGSAMPVLVFGEQRSGTNMLLRCFGRCPTTAMYNETDDDAFEDYELRSLDIVRRLIERSPASHVVLKPTADGNRAREIIEQLPGARSIWIYRDYRDAISSALVLFRETSIEYLTNVANRSPKARWRAINITDDDAILIRGHLRRGISEQSARALIWAIRNGFFFRMGLDQRSDVLLLNYEELVRDPVTVVERAYQFVGLEFNEKYTRNVFATSIGRRPPPEIDPEIEHECMGVLARLDDCRRRQSGTLTTLIEPQ